MNTKRLLENLKNGGDFRYMRMQPAESNTVAICHNKIHYGKMSKKMLQEHKCLEKGCPFLEKVDCSFWKQREELKQKKKADKMRKGLQDALRRRDYEFVGETIARLIFQK